MADNYPHIHSTIWTQDFAVELMQYLLPHPRITYRKYSERPLGLKISTFIYQFPYTEGLVRRLRGWGFPKPAAVFDQKRLTTLHLHLTTHAFLILMDQVPPSEESMQYPQAPKVHVYDLEGSSIEPLLAEHDGEYEDHKPYIVFTVGYTSDTRKWPAFAINQLARMCAKRGLTPVLLGTTKKLNVGQSNDYIKAGVDDDIDRRLFVDLVDRTSLVEALGIIQRARAVVGVDNGLLHLAHCTDAPVVAGYTTLKPEHRLPARPKGKTEVVTAAVPCGGCQSRGFAINTDWRTCLFEDYACTLTMSADRFYKALQNLGVIA